LRTAFIVPVASSFFSFKVAASLSFSSTCVLPSNLYQQ